MKNILKKKYIGAANMILATILFLTAEFVTSLGWSIPTYSYLYNTISDLGVPIITESINSPSYSLMNFIFITYGILLALSYFFIRPSITKNIYTKIGSIFLIFHGLGVILVGIFPGYQWSLFFLHILGAAIAILIGNIGIIFLGVGLYKERDGTYSKLGVVLGIIGILSLIIPMIMGITRYSGLFERIAVYTIFLWNMIYGINILLKKEKLI